MAGDPGAPFPDRRALRRDSFYVMQKVFKFAPSKCPPGIK